MAAQFCGRNHFGVLSRPALTEYAINITAEIVKISIDQLAQRGKIEEGCAQESTIKEI